MTLRRGHFNKNVKDGNKSVQQLSEKNIHDHNAKTYAENDRTKLPNLNSNNDKYDTVASNSYETNFQQFAIVNVNQLNEDQAEDYDYLNNQFCNRRYSSKKLPVPHTATTTVYTERFRKKIMEEDEVEKKLKLLLQEKNEQPTNINNDDKENHSYPGILNSNVDDAISENKEIICNLTDNTNITESNTVCSTNQQKSASSIKDSKKRSSNVDTPSSKRQKLDVEPNMCTNKTTISDENVFLGFNHEMTSTKNKLNNEENNNPHTERNISNNNKYDKDSRSHNTYYKKENVQEFCNDHNKYFKDSIEHGHEKDTYNYKRNKSPVLKHSNRKHKHHDDRYNKDHKDKNRDKDKTRSNEKYGTTDCHSSKSKGNKSSNLHDTKSVLHERSKSKTKESTNYKTDDKKYSKHTKHNRNSEDRESTPCERKGKIDELQTINVVKKTNDLLNESIKADSNDSLEEGEIVSPSKSNLNNKTDDTKLISEKNVNVEIRKDSSKITFDQFEDKLKPANKVDTRTCLTKKDREHLGDNKNIHQIEKAKVATTVNTCSENTSIPLVDNKQDTTVTLTNNVQNDVKNVTVKENKSKVDKIVQLQKNAKGSDSTRSNIENLSEDILKSNTKNSSEISQENNIVFKNNDKKEDKRVPNISKVGLNKDNVSSIDKFEKEDNNHQQESLQKAHEETVAIDLQENKKDNENMHVKAKATKSSKKEMKSDDSEVIIFARRRKHINLTDNNASMTVVINPKNTNSDVIVKDIVENNLKQRACKVFRSYKDLCKDDI
ncbi:PREDICTED: homeobox protein 2-like isoform X1 [Polistes dominula]|nr:PREDICTED: homeobox protein 2-like isoform X1 [Polistes dominula]